MGVESKSDGQSTASVWIRAHTPIWSLRVVKNDRTDTRQGLEYRQPTMERGTPFRYLQVLGPHHLTIKKVPALHRPNITTTTKLIVPAWHKGQNRYFDVNS